MTLNLDFSNAKEFKNPDEGEHVFIIEDAEVKPSKAGDSNNLVIKASVVGGENDGRNAIQYFSLKPEALWNVKLFLEAVAGEEMTEINIDESELVGQTFIATVIHSEDGKYANLEVFKSNS